MNNHKITLFLIVSLTTSFFIIQPTYSSLLPKDLVTNKDNTRRILHQPLFPASSPPPADIQPPPATALPNPDQPFFPEVPAGPTPNQAQQQQPPASVNGTSISIPIATQPAKPTKKVAIAISVGIVTLGMLSGLAFYLYKHRGKHPDESQKLVGPNSHRLNEESRLPPSTFLYIGTVEPSNSTTIGNTDDTNGSPYHKLNSTKRSDRYRPSPDLQPLPPLSKPQPPPTMNSPPAMSSSDEESQESAFYTPHGSSVSNEEGYSTSSRRSRLGDSTRTQPLVTSLVPYSKRSSPTHSKRTSPKSRLSVSSAETIIPSIKQPPVTPPPPPPPPVPIQKQKPQYFQPTLLAYSPRRAKFSAPPPPPDMTSLHSVHKQSQERSKIPIPPPPPPPPQSQKLVDVKTVVPSMDLQPYNKLQSRSTITPRTEYATAETEDFSEAPYLLRKSDADDMDGSKPKLKPLHWDKVRATSERATVWDQLKSSSFQ